MRSHWVLNSAEKGTARLASEFDIHPAIASILLRRGLKTSPEIFSFLNPSLESLQDPFAFQDMKKAVERIRLAVARSEKILVYGDYDVDGITGSAILYPVLKTLGADAEVHIPHRVDEGYGLNLDSLQKLMERGFGVVITVDNGITGIEQVKYLVSRGVDVIIVDHHMPKGGALPPAFAIVSAFIGDQKGDPNLAACGVAFKLAWALLGNLQEACRYLDLVALGTVADLAPVLGDNRILLKYGLAALSKTPRPGLRALMDIARIPRRLVSYRDIAFGLGPRINAAGRMDTPRHAFDLLTTTDVPEAVRLAALLDKGNKERQRVEAAAYLEAAARVEREFFEEENRILVVESDGWHEGVLGIVAARLVERFRRPSIVIALKNDMGKGSGRSVPRFSLFETVYKCEDLLVNFGGHAQACGLTIRRENIEDFRRRLNETARDSAAGELAVPLGIEAELPPGDLDTKFLTDLERLAPFGPGNKKPLFLSRGMRVKGEIKKRGKDTLLCWMTDRTGKMTCEVLGFRSYERWNAAGRQADYEIVYQPVLKEFSGIVSIQLELEDWE